MLTMNRQITPPAVMDGVPQESDFMSIGTYIPVPDQVMSNIDHACGQY
jgi:hypothetical protein